MCLILQDCSISAPESVLPRKMHKAEVSVASKPKSMLHKVEKHNIDNFLSATSFNKPLIPALPAKSHRVDRTNETAVYKGHSRLKRGGAAMFHKPERKKFKKHQVWRIGFPSHFRPSLCSCVHKKWVEVITLGCFWSRLPFFLSFAAQFSSCSW